MPCSSTGEGLEGKKAERESGDLINWSAAHMATSLFIAYHVLRCIHGNYQTWLQAMLLAQALGLRLTGDYQAGQERV